eukprot:CAMPEP_0182896854 /NCGR_PEP_ID=MMETSP0034_2-20130328/26532_1 /TAXON_ID=156128 /ORGANISM="Nephroselmis pyriformis, Strain CCMP717" /LENGTH=74 /DNA_ID=CAMNT_0025030739 /DNA_START=255 /DNA_END=479 /DNA_ORIENTATION=+
MVWLVSPPPRALSFSSSACWRPSVTPIVMKPTAAAPTKQTAVKAPIMPADSLVTCTMRRQEELFSYSQLIFEEV